MKTYLLMVVWLAFSSAGLFGCRSAPVQEVENVPVKMNKANYSLADVENAILHAGACQRWQMYRVKPGTIQATYAHPDFSAEATITYSTKAYSIHYHNSHNLGYEDGEIHENYNSWVAKLNDAIQRELSFRELAGLQAGCRALGA